MSDFGRVQALLEAQEWRYAKTMPKTPHWYSLRKNWTDDAAFAYVNAFIREHGTDERFRGRVDQVLLAGNYKYWTVWDNSLINRAWIGDLLGVPTPPEFVEILAKKDPDAYK